jgi:uncharacterized protein
MAGPTSCDEPSPMPTSLRERLQADLPDAMRARDRDLTSVLRTTLAAIANAEAVDHIGSNPAAGVGTNDVDRRELSDEEILTIVVAERDRLRELGAEMTAIGQHDEASSLLEQAAVLHRYVTAI